MGPQFLHLPKRVNDMQEAITLQTALLHLFKFHISSVTFFFFHRPLLIMIRLLITRHWSFINHSFYHNEIWIRHRVISLIIELQTLILATIQTLKRNNKRCGMEEVFQLVLESLKSDFIKESFDKILDFLIKN